jgi:hypothetical protein
LEVHLVDGFRKVVLNRPGKRFQEKIGQTGHTDETEEGGQEERLLIRKDQKPLDENKKQKQGGKKND